MSTPNYFPDKSRLEELLTAFDMDFVQCALEDNEMGQIRIVKSTIAHVAHQNKQITYIQD